MIVMIYEDSVYWCIFMPTSIKQPIVKFILAPLIIGNETLLSNIALEFFPVGQFTVRKKNKPYRIKFDLT